jgi:hypothetical protein
MLPIFIHVWQSEIDYFEPILYIQEHIFWFDVAVCDSKTMKVLQSRNNLREVVMRLLLTPPEYPQLYTLPSII